ncbi:MAG: Fe-S cluster assembly protein SufD [Candidatus Aenigmarchaeota archaeon]|nr:Fe-S cluster assembly protein SufD [Candidatus Aenigmarchaeota archaeon]
MSVNDKLPVGGSWLQEKRRQAWESFAAKPYPIIRYGLNITTDAGGLSLENLSIPQPKPPKVENRNKGIIVTDIFTALNEYPDIVEKHLFKSLGYAECACGNCIPNTAANEKFLSFHQSMFNAGLLVYAPKGAEAEHPVHIDSRVDGALLEHTLVVAEPLSRLAIMENLHGDGSFRSGIVEVFAGDGSSVNFGSMQNYGEGLVNFSMKKAVVNKDANMEWVTCDTGARLTKSDVSSVLDGSGARTMNRGMFFGRGGQHFDFHVNAIHARQSTESYLLTRGALYDSSKAIYRGLIKMTRDARGAIGYQKADTLLLGEHAEADPVPYLEIDNNEVKCGHATTVGQVDAEKMFYLMSRGLGEEEARARIVEGFFEPLIRLLHADRIQKEARALIHNGIMRNIGRAAVTL